MKRRMTAGVMAAMVLGGAVLGGAAMAAGGGATELFNGKDLSGWTPIGRVNRNHWKVGKAEIDPKAKFAPQMLKAQPGGGDLVSPGIVGADLRTQREFDDAKVSFEFMVPPVKPMANAGVFILGEYELQILWDPKADAAKPTDMDQGAVVRAIAPRKLAVKQPGEWQSYEIEYVAPRFDAAGNKTSSLKLVKVVINGEVVHENVEVAGPTPGGITEKDVARGPLVLQGSEGPVAFRNIRVTER